MTPEVSTAIAELVRNVSANLSNIGAGLLTIFVVWCIFR